MAPLPEAAPFFRTLLSLNGFAGRSRQHRYLARHDPMRLLSEVVTQRSVVGHKESTT